MCESVEKGGHFPRCSFSKALAATNTTTAVALPNLLGCWHVEETGSGDGGGGISKSSAAASVLPANTYQKGVFRSQEKKKVISADEVRSAAALVHIFREIATTMPPSGKFPCPICSNKFDSPKDLGIHILKDHSDGGGKEDEEEEVDEKPDLSQLQPPPPQPVSLSKNDQGVKGNSTKSPPMVSIPVTSSKPAVTVTDKIIEMRVDALADAIDDMIEENKPQDHDDDK